MRLTKKNQLGRNFLVLVLLVVVAIFFIGCGEKVYHVGILSGLNFFAKTADGFKAKMTELGYVEGKNIFYDHQKVNSDAAQDKIILQKFVTDKVDLIFGFPTDVALYAQAATKDTKIPVLFANANIEGVGLVNSTAAPGGNITGVRFPGPDLTIKRFEVLHELAPQAKRMLVAYKKDNPVVPVQLAALRPKMEAEGITLVDLPALSPADIAAALQERAKSADIGCDSILMIAEPLTTSPQSFLLLAKFAAEHKIPIGGSMMSVEGYNSIFGIATDDIAVGKQAAVLADKILKGAQPAVVPVVSAESFMQINLKAAEALGLKVNDNLLSQANQVIR